ncbi:hypothetical protein QQF64_034299, partial [Cirrhinus molitorella]
DKGYPLTEYLITPLANPATEQEHRFNTAHIRTQATVERCIGLLKGRWLCLRSAGGPQLSEPRVVVLEQFWGWKTRALVHSSRLPGFVWQAPGWFVGAKYRWYSPLTDLKVNK